MNTSTTLELGQLLRESGLRNGPAQVWRGLRLVPLIADSFHNDLRLARRVYEDFLTVVDLPDDMAYCAYVPHAYVVSWTPEGQAQCLPDTQLGKSDGKQMRDLPVRRMNKLSKREKRRIGPQTQNQLRFLPMHLSLEGYLALYFEGPTIDWSEDYLRRFMYDGLSQHTEYMVYGEFIPGFDEALRIFEIHPGQVGMLLYIADALASAVIYPHPADYRLLHRSLIEDFFSEIIGYHYANLPFQAPQIPLPAAGSIHSLADLRRDLSRSAGEIDAFQLWMAEGVLARPVRLKPVNSLGPYRLERFMSVLAADSLDQAHMGEVILGPKDRLAYLKTCALNPSQIRRAWLLERLDAHDWNLDATAEALGMTRQKLVLRLDAVDLGYMLQPKVIEAAKKGTLPPRKK